MKLKRTGKDSRGEYTAIEYVFRYPDRPLCERIAARLGLTPPDGRHVDQVFLIGVGVKKFRETRSRMIAELREYPCTLIKDVEDTVYHAKYEIEGVSVEVGVEKLKTSLGGERKKGSVGVVVRGRLESEWIDIPPIDMGDLDKFFVIDMKTLLDLPDRCVYDLQSGSDYCYTCFESTNVDGQTKALWLYGNGWADKCGYPVIEEVGQYAAFVGKTAKKLRGFLDAGRIPDFDEIWDGTLDELRIIRSTEQMEKMGLKT